MKVLILSDSTEWGGLETHALALAETVDACGHHATIGCLGPGAHRLYRMMAPPAVRLIELPRPRRDTPLAWWRTLRHVEADAVVLEKGTLHTGGWGLDVVLRMKCRSFVTVQQLEPPVLPPRASRTYAGGVPGLGLWWYRWKWSGYRRSLLPQVTVAVSEAVRRRLIDDYAFPEDRTITIPNGVNPVAFESRPDERAAVRKAWGVPDDAFVFGSLGRLSPQKALEVAIDSFSRIVGRSTGRDLFLVLVGEGWERPALEAQARALGVEHRVILPGFMPSPRAAYQGFDVFVIPSRYEGLPFALVEAMASGCRIVGTHVGGIPEVVTHPGLGTLVPPDDADALAAAMGRALDCSAADAAAESAAVRRRVHESFDIRLQCRRIVALLESQTAARTATRTPDPRPLAPEPSGRSEGS